MVNKKRDLLGPLLLLYLTTKGPIPIVFAYLKIDRRVAQAEHLDLKDIRYLELERTMHGCYLLFGLANR